MAVIPEIIIQKAIVNGLQALKADPRLIDVLFRNMNQGRLAALKAYLLKTSIDYSVNYPRKGQLNVPAIVLIMRNESEAETFLGDMMGVHPGTYGVPDQDLMEDTIPNHGGSVSDLGGLGSPVVQGLEVDLSLGASVAIADASEEAFHDTYLEILQGNNYSVHVVAGTGAGQVRLIISASENSLDVDSPFNVDLDSTSVIDIRRVGEVPTEGEPSRVYDTNGVYERIGVHYDAQYQIQVIASNQDEVIHLYSIIKALLLSQRPFLEGQGMMVFKLSGSDFAPRGEYLPSDVFMRVLNLQFTYPFSFLRELTVAKSIEIDLQPDELGAPGTGDLIRIGTLTIE